MLKHVVMWHFREQTEGKSRQAHAQWMKEHLERLIGVVPEIRSLKHTLPIKRSVPIANRYAKAVLW